MRGNGFEFVRRQPDCRNWFLAHQRIGKLLQDGLFRFAGVATETRLDRLEVFHQQVAERSATRENGVDSEQLLLFHNVHLGIGFFLRLNQFIGLVQARVFDVVLAQSDAGNAKQAKLHPHCLGSRGHGVKVGSDLSPCLTRISRIRTNGASTLVRVR